MLRWFGNWKLQACKTLQVEMFTLFLTGKPNIALGLFTGQEKLEPPVPEEEQAGQQEQKFRI